ncbi:MAG: PAS domain S-box protein [Chloroflexi bacterium]|nr:PAS domain S-box protein [Chloroflexota bacterium]
MWRRWREASVDERVRWLRWALPVIIAALVLLYQLGFTSFIHDAVGDAAHTMVEVAFYSVVGPVVTWVTLGFIGKWLREKEVIEQKARAQEHHLASIIAASADAILSVDRKNMILTWNRAAERILGYRAEEMIGRSLARLFVTDMTRVSQPQWLADPTRPLHQFETTVVTKTGRTLPVELTRTPLRDQTGRERGASVILRDISPRKARQALLNEERARIARDLHDGLAQSLYFLGLKLDLIRKLIKTDAEEAERELRELKRTVQAGIAEVRRTIFALRPLELDELGLEEAMRRYIRGFGEQTGLEIGFEVAGSPANAPDSLAPMLFRVVQEGLNNVAKHAQAQRAQVTLAVDEQTCRLEIWDDGVGFDPDRVWSERATKVGLRQMRERVEAVGGALSIESKPGLGARVLVEVPIEESEA